MSVRALRLRNIRNEISLVLLRIRRTRALRNGLALAREGKTEEAIVLLSQAHGGTAEDAGVHNALAGLLLSLGRYPEALEEINLAIILDPDSADQYINRGNINRGLEKYEDAVCDYTRAISLNPDDTGGMISLAMVLNRIGRHAEALEAAAKALAIDPSCEPAWFHAGNAFFALRRFEEARDAYSWAPGIYPNDSYAWKDRADRLMKQGRVAEARKASDMAALVAVKKLNIRRCEKEIERLRRERDPP
jgi:tetratricopeptide (TPR) repeat protein